MGCTTRPTRGGSGYGTDNATPGKYEDLIGFMTAADELALDLLSEGITGMKIWPFDYLSQQGMMENWRSFQGAFDPNLRADNETVANRVSHTSIAQVRVEGDADVATHEEIVASQGTDVVELQRLDE